MMHIRIDAHTLERAGERGASREEIEEVIRTGSTVPARSGRLARTKVFPFARWWRGGQYEQKMVKVVYSVEGEVATTVTVYVFYGKWEG